MQNSLSRSNRLRQQSDFKETFRMSRRKRHGRIQKLEHYLLYQYESSEQTRIGISVSKKVARKATERNRIKRCIREFFRQNKNLFRGDTVIRLTSRPKRLDYRHLVEPLKKRLQRKASSPQC